MIKKSFTIPFFEVKMVYIIIEGVFDYEVLKKTLKSYTALDNELRDRALDIVRTGKVNGGDTIRHLETREMLCIIYQCTSEAKRLNIICHEKRHIEDRLLEFFGINDIETAGFLAGFLGDKMLNYKLTK